MSWLVNHIKLFKKVKSEIEDKRIKNGKSEDDWTLEEYLKEIGGEGNEINKQELLKRLK